MISRGLAWHFLARPDLYRDGRMVRVGEWLTHDGPLVPCSSGLHASARAIDALGYAPGPYVSLVEIGGRVVHGLDKLVCSRRRPLWIADATDVLFWFGRECARDVIHLWSPPAEVLRWLDEDTDHDEAARRAAEREARSAAEREARSAAERGAWSAAWSAARSAAWSAAWSAARSAALSAALSADLTAALSAAWSAQNATLESILMELAP